MQRERVCIGVGLGQWSRGVCAAWWGGQDALRTRRTLSLMRRLALRRMDPHAQEPLTPGHPGGVGSTPSSAGGAAGGTPSAAGSRVSGAAAAAADPRRASGGGFLDNLSEAYKEHHIINDFIFPGSSPTSYSWESFKEGELICIDAGGDEQLVIPALLLRGTAPQRQPAVPRSGSADGGSIASPSPAEPASTLVIYCHANSEDLGSIYACAQWLCQMLGVHVLVPEYPGYGLCAGNPCESSVNSAVLAACRWARCCLTRYTHAHTHTHTLCRWARDCLKWDSEHVLIYGRSIGTGPAIYAAKLGLVSGVVLVSPYTSVREIVQEHVGSVISWLTAGSSDWNSLDMMRDVQCPVPKP